MERIPATAPQILAVPNNNTRPLWSVMIPVFNCSKYLPEVLRSVLLQDPGHEQMQIEVVDDASTDADVEVLVQSLGKGRVKYYRQPQNVGSLRNFETCINRARGKLVHLLHGDDRIKPGFYEKMEELFLQYPDAGAAFSRYSFINEEGVESKAYQIEAEKDGVLQNWLIRIAERQRIQYVAMVVRREVYESIGSFYGANYGEDWEMWVRIAKYYPVAYTPEVLAEYRGHFGSITWGKAVSGKMYHDLVDSIKRIQMHVPKEDRKRVLIRSKEHCAHYLLGMAISIWKESQDFAISQSLLKQAISLSKSPYIIGRVLKFYFKVLLSYIQLNKRNSGY